MAMTKEEVFEVFRYYASKEFEDIPVNESEIKSEFSDEFNKKMAKLLKRVSYDRTHIVSWTGKKIILVAATIILMISGVMSVGAIREPIVEFIYNVYEEFIEIFFGGDTTDKITYRYSLTEIPEGFVETHNISNKSVNIVEYENVNNNHKIELCQSKTKNTSLILDTQKGYVKKFNINKINVDVYISNYGNYYYAVWTQDSYAISLTYSGATTVEEIINLINSIH